MEYKFRDVLERDMDMLILEELAYSNEFCKIFLDKVDIKGASLLLTWHSKTDEELGETDMTAVFLCDKKKVALLIEDKIDAIAMPEQPSRYILRGNKGVACGDYDEYYVFIVAPHRYLEKNEKAKEYSHSVSYEEIREYFEKLKDGRSSFKLAQINAAIEKQEKGYQVIQNVSVTNFWKQYVEYKNKYFSQLNLVNESDIKPTKGVWTHFRTNDSRACIYYKSNKGFIDLTFNGQAKKIDKIKEFVKNALGDYFKKEMMIVKTGKSCAIRKRIPIVDFSKPFETQAAYIKQSFEVVEEFYEISKMLDIAGIFTF